MNREPSATVVITTKNRRDDLRKAIASSLNQDAAPSVLVIDDGSTDGTSEMVRAEFPGVRLDRSESSLGLIVQRNRAAKMATAPIIFSIDDDAIFSSPRIVTQTLADFHPDRVGAVAIPFVNVNQNNKLLHLAPDDNRIFITGSFVGTSHAVRRDLFLSLGGYREIFFHQGEEADFCIRMLAAGYVVRLGRADPVHHYESPNRDTRRMDLYGRRNDLLFTWFNVPMPWFPLHLSATTLLGIRRGFQLGRPLRMLRGVAMGYDQFFPQRKARQPVPRAVYRLFRRLGSKESFELVAIEPLLPKPSLHG